MIIAVEDILSEVVARKILHSVRPDLSVTTVLGHRGKSYLKTKVRELNRTAMAVPVLLLVDLDTPSVCPPSLISSWLGGPAQPKLLFRVAVMEIETWIIADRERFARFLGVPEGRIPRAVDEILNPKEQVVLLARSSRSQAVREEMVPSPGSTASVGPGYNARLSEFVHNQWEPESAASASPSLARMIRRLVAFR